MRTGALMFLDLDHFKLLNDSQRHGVGDVLLEQVAKRLQSCVMISAPAIRRCRISNAYR